MLKISERLRKEELIRVKLGKELEMEFKKQKVKLKGIEEEWEADLVSDDGTIVGEVKTASFGGKKGTAIPRNLCSPYILLKNVVGAKRRLLIYTEKSLLKHVMKSREGKLVKNDGIEIILWNFEENTFKDENDKVKMW